MRYNFSSQLKVKEKREVITLKDSPLMYNTPCYLLPSGATTTSTATPPYLPTPTNTSTPLLPTPTIVHHLASTPQPAPYFAFTGTVKPRKHLENTGRFSSLRCSLHLVTFCYILRNIFNLIILLRRPSLERCLQVMGANR